MDPNPSQAFGSSLLLAIVYSFRILGGAFFFFGLCGGGLWDWMDPNPSQALKLKFTLGHCLFLCLFLYLSRYVHVVFALISFAGSRESIYYVFAGRGGSWL